MVEENGDMGESTQENGIDSDNNNLICYSKIFLAEQRCPTTWGV